MSIDEHHELLVGWLCCLGLAWILLEVSALRDQEHVWEVGTHGKKEAVDFVHT